MPSKSSIKKNIIIYLIIPAIFLFAIIMILFGTDNNVNLTNVEYITSLGWQVDERCADISYLTIPSEFDSVFSAYNDIIAEGGFDLTPYKNCRAVRYSYIVQNFKSLPSESVRINILIYQGKIISADISSLAPGGFLKALTPAP